MPIAPNPHRTATTASEKKAEGFIAGAGKKADQAEPRKLVPVMIKVDPAMLERFNAAARRLGINRTAFIISSTVEKLERIGG